MKYWLRRSVILVICWLRCDWRVQTGSEQVWGCVLGKTWHRREKNGTRHHGDPWNSTDNSKVYSFQCLRDCLLDTRNPDIVTVAVWAFAIKANWLRREELNQLLTLAVPCGLNAGTWPLPVCVTHRHWTSSRATPSPDHRSVSSLPADRVNSHSLDWR